MSEDNLIGKRPKTSPEKLVTEDSSTNEKRKVKRVSFASSSFVKPFAVDPEINTLWDDTYEEELHDSDRSICSTLDQSFLENADFEEYNKENYNPTKPFLTEDNITFRKKIFKTNLETKGNATKSNMNDTPKITDKPREEINKELSEQMYTSVGASNDIYPTEVDNSQSSTDFIKLHFESDGTTFENIFPATCEQIKLYKTVTDRKLVEDCDIRVDTGPLTSQKYNKNSTESEQQCNTIHDSYSGKSFHKQAKGVLDLAKVSDSDIYTNLLDKLAEADLRNLELLESSEKPNETAAADLKEMHQLELGSGAEYGSNSKEETELSDAVLQTLRELVEEAVTRSADY
ncbi:uncharacterized protein LOC130898194 isoform X1 [Diorhabda carinulata]|uniref:uncharacterized protein LOC130898194 isoform X1 n=1 Tax=Diorhabda carinulata TaxID=1163345 RepID=UPI0025A25242|nr:uncharacterized protein LOC130898194 isoform X1 [Diorhabda carinulata]